MAPPWNSANFGLDEPPSCLLSEALELPCPECPFWDRNPCPIESDPEYRSFVAWDAERRDEFRHRRAAQSEELRDILRAHGLPLHWEVLGAIAVAQRPDLFESTRSVLRLMSWRPDEFESMGDGVYRLARD